MSINFSWSKGGAQHYLSSDFPRSHPTEFPSSPNATISLKHDCSRCKSISQSINQSINQEIRCGKNFPRGKLER